jgi:hypothetical protein
MCTPTGMGCQSDALAVNLARPQADLTFDALQPRCGQAHLAGCGIRVLNADFHEPFDTHRSLVVTSLVEIGSAIALGYTHYFTDVMAASFLWATMEWAWERMTTVDRRIGGQGSG